MTREEIEELYRSYKATLLATARRAVPSEDDAEEVLQGAFVRFIPRAEMLKPEGAPSYLFRCVCTSAADWWRRDSQRKRVSGTTAASDSMSEEATPAEWVEENEELNATRKAIARLPQREHEVVMLRYFGGLSYDHAAKLMRCRPSTVRSLLRHALSRLRKALKVKER